MGKFEKSGAGAGAKHQSSHHSKRSTNGNDSDNKKKNVVKSKGGNKKWSKPKPGHKEAGSQGKGLVKAIIEKHSKKVESSKGDKHDGKKVAKHAGAKASSGKAAAPKTNAKVELVGNLISDWNKVRIKSIEVKDRSRLIDKLMKSIKGHVLQVTLRHDVSRIVQCILQFGTNAQRSAIVNEMVPKMFEICKTPYGHFTVLKAISYCTVEEDHQKIVNALKKHFVSLGTNVIGARTVESMLKIFPSKLTRTLKAEFYGKNFVILMDEPPRSLRALIEALPSRQNPILDHMASLIQKLINKKLLIFDYVHQLVWECIQEIQGNNERKKQMDVMVNLLVESGLQMMTSKPGARAMCSVVSAAIAKDRKRIIKSLKDHVLESALHSSGHLYLMRVIDVVDDTVTVQKSLLAEIRSLKSSPQYTATGELIPNSDLPPLAKVALSAVGSKVLLRLLAPSKRHLEPDEEPLFATQPETSKKNPAQRRKELLLYMRPALLTLGVRYGPLLARSRPGSRVLQEIVSVFNPPSVLRAIISTMLEQQPVDDGEQEMEEEEEAEEEGEEEEEMDEEEAEEGANDDDNEDDEEDDQDMDEEGEQELADADEANEDDDNDDNDKDEDNAVVTQVLAIEEDPNAHATLRRVLDIQLALSNGDAAAAETVNSEFHESPTDESDNVNVALSLLSEIFEQNGLLQRWTNSSRGCFSVAHMLQDSATRAKFLPVVAATTPAKGKGKSKSAPAAPASAGKASEIKAAVAAGNAADSPGAKKLLEVVG